MIYIPIEINVWFTYLLHLGTFVSPHLLFPHILWGPSPTHLGEVKVATKTDSAKSFQQTFWMENFPASFRCSTCERPSSLASCYGHHCRARWICGLDPSLLGSPGGEDAKRPNYSRGRQSLHRALWSADPIMGDVSKACNRHRPLFKHRLALIARVVIYAHVVHHRVLLVTWDPCKKDAPPMPGCQKTQMTLLDISSIFNKSNLAKWHHISPSPKRAPISHPQKHWLWLNRMVLWPSRVYCFTTQLLWLVVKKWLFLQVKLDNFPKPL